MATNTATLKTFAQQTRAKLVQLITTRLQFVLHADTAELRGYEHELGHLRKELSTKSEQGVIEEVAYTWFNRIMALRFMDANGYQTPMAITPVPGQMRPEILQDAMGGTIDEELGLSETDKMLPEAKLYRKLLVAVCNRLYQPMPFLFERIADYTELLLPDDLLSDQSFVTDIRRGMTDEDCQNVEITGWLYQFYITDRKADAEKKKSKKGGLKSDEQAAATQLFTPHWIVRYMVENSLGRIWMILHPDSHLVEQMPYYIRPTDNQQDPLPEGIQSVKDIRFVDPCTGSGHVLVYAFDLFTFMYEEEGFSRREIPALILQNNLYGMDIDRRCYQLACFALTMKARAYYSRYLRNTVQPNIIAFQPIDHDTIASTGEWPYESLMWQFQYIDTIGSLLKITPEECVSIHIDNGLFGERQRLMKRQAEYLSQKYHCVVTNPPYLGKGISDDLKLYVQDQFPDSKADLMATFMERAMSFLSLDGRMSMINMQSWMLLSSYERLRKSFLSNYQIQSLLHLGPHAFDEINGEIVRNAAFVVMNSNVKSPRQSWAATYFRLVNGKNSSEKEKMFLNANLNHTEKIYYSNIKQNSFEEFPGWLMGYWLSDKLKKVFDSTTLNDVAKVVIGIKTGDNDVFLKQWQEVNKEDIGFGLKNLPDINNSESRWFPYVKGGEYRKWYGNQSLIINWENKGLNMVNHTNKNGMKDARIRQSNFPYYGKCYLTWSRIGSDNFSVRYVPNGVFFDCNSPSVFEQEHDLYFILGFLNSNVVIPILKLTASSVTFQIQDIKSIPYFDTIEQERKIKDLVNENILIAKQDWDAHETSWDFQQNELVLLHFHFRDTSAISNLDIEELMGEYKTRWEARFIQLHANEEELNRLFIEIYGLKDELKPNVSFDEITILQKGEISIEKAAENVRCRFVWHEDVIIKQLISYLVGCFMGRYSVDRPGLIIASQHTDLATLGLDVDGIVETNNNTLTIDDDGIIPIVEDADFFADDMTRRIELAIKKLFGEEQFYKNMDYLKKTLKQDLRSYLYKDFYADHQQMYSVKGAKRPIYWLFSSRMGDKKKHGYFKALVYMHRMEQDTLSRLHADYVHPYLTKAEQQLRETEDDALRDNLNQTQRNRSIRLAEELREKVREVKQFEQQLVEMASHRMSIDLDDGIKANYPKFYPLVESIKGLEASDNDEE